MPTSTQANYFYLGNHPDIDPDESDFEAENAGALVGTYSKPPIVTVTNHDQDDSGAIRDNEDNPAGDFASYDAGNGATSQFVDSTIYYFADVLLGDGSVVSMELMVIQMENGDVFLVDRAPPNSLDGLRVQSISLTSPSSTTFGGYMTSNSVQSASTVCFVDKTRIETVAGPCRAADVTAGMQVLTRDHGPQPCREVVVRRLPAPGRNAPVCLPARLFGLSAEAPALRVSPQHRLLVNSPIARRMFGVAEVLIAARMLLPLPGVSQDDPQVPVTYVHLLFDRHEILQADGFAAESLYAGEQARAVLGRTGHGHAPLPPMRPARPFIMGRRAKRLIARHLRNAKPLGPAPSAPDARVGALSGQDRFEATRLVQ